MRRTIAAVGLLGLGLLGATLPASATPDNGHGNNVSICHETGSESNPIVNIDVNENALNGHGPGSNNGQGGNGGPGGNNGQGGGPGGNNGQGGGPGGNNGQGGHDDDECYQEPGSNEEPNVPPVVDTPAEPPAVAPPVVAPPVVAPPVAAPPAVVPEAPAAPVAKPVVKPAAKPAAVPAAAAPAAAAPVAAMPAAAPASNAGYNVQTAAGGDAGAGVPSWLATLTGALAGLSGLVLLRGGMRARKLQG